MKGAALGVLTGVLAGFCVACGAEDDTMVTVYAAASLSEAFEELAQQFEATHPEVDVRLSFAGSARLAAQITAGARADVFASADTVTMDRVVHAGRTADHPLVFARNRLALAVPAHNPADVSGLADLTDDSLVVAVCAPEVPCGALAEAVLDDAGLAVDADTEETSVRAVLTKVALGEADAGLVYATDIAAGGNRVAEVSLGPSGFRTDYPIAPVSDQSRAADFVDFVTGPAGADILRRHGFETP
ncbi:molybdate ABC transporter substrate-binding protein [Candidatus Poriferisocius sp.]|uniref:molybdate ABC transporter substrate-binding protein n=1 Tax=Candidatus Poriferisocius sp. TaxID=3101276 RepID=UPI003B5BAD5B